LIRLTDERWSHIVEEPGELVGYRRDVLTAIAQPARVLAGFRGELFAITEIASGKWLVVVYREIGDDGFVITAFVTTRSASLSRKAQVWPR
jgi:hypothetical protein